MRLFTLFTLATLSALPAAAETDHSLPPGVNEAVAAWFSHCAAFSTENEFVETFASTACVSRPLNMCRAAEGADPGSGCFDRLERQLRDAEAALLPELDRLLAILPKGFDRQAIERELARRAAPMEPWTCTEGLAPLECDAFRAAMDWANLRTLLWVRTPR